jgi:Rho family protein
MENVETKWMAEIAEHCPTAKIVVVALKCDLREEVADEKGENAAAGTESSSQAQPKRIITYAEGLAVAKRIGALRYLGTAKRRNLKTGTPLTSLECSAMRNRGVNEAFMEASRVALSVKPAKSADSSHKCVIL